MVTVPEWIRTKKGLILLGSVAGVSATAGVLVWNYRRRIITIDFAKPSVTGCSTDTQKVTITITDGYHRPLGLKDFYLQVYWNGRAAFKEPVKLKTRPDGTWTATWDETGWYTDKPLHVDRDETLTETWEVTCDGYTASNSYNIIFKACTDFKLCCQWTEEGKTVKGYFCYYTTCPEGTEPCPTA
jgi:hypothetical protein